MKKLRLKEVTAQGHILVVGMVMSSQAEIWTKDWSQDPNTWSPDDMVSAAEIQGNLMSVLEHMWPPEGFWQTSLCSACHYSLDQHHRLLLCATTERDPWGPLCYGNHAAQVSKMFSWGRGWEKEGSGWEHTGQWLVSASPWILSLLWGDPKSDMYLKNIRKSHMGV